MYKWEALRGILDSTVCASIKNEIPPPVHSWKSLMEWKHK
jgi:hypothetical protein